jgi:hypothetical protein
MPDDLAAAARAGLTDCEIARTMASARCGRHRLIEHQAGREIIRWPR